VKWSGLNLIELKGGRDEGRKSRKEVMEGCEGRKGKEGVKRSGGKKW
jgi:hypothetical protein